MEDHGEILTKLEQLFGSVCEDEVIKLILQNCDWKMDKAMETLLEMTELEDLPPEFLSQISSDVKTSDICTNTTTKEPEKPDPNLTVNGGEVMVPNENAMEFSGVAVPKTSNRKRNNLFDKPVIDADTNKQTSLNWSAPEFFPNTLTHMPGAAFYGRNTEMQQIFNKKVENKVNVNENTARQIDLHNGRQNISSNCNLVKNSNLISQKNQSNEVIKERIMDLISRGEKIMVLMRGLPGSGKTTLANQIIKPGGVVISTDDYFLDREGRYCFDRNKISNAHSWNQQRAFKHTRKEKTPIIVDNTNIELWEMKPYIKIALENNYHVEFLEPSTDWKFNPKILSKTNLHNVPREKIEDMMSRFQNIRVEDVINKFNKSNRKINSENAATSSTPSPGSTNNQELVPIQLRSESDSPLEQFYDRSENNIDMSTLNNYLSSSRQNLNEPTFITEVPQQNNEDQNNVGEENMSTTKNEETNDEEIGIKNTDFIQKLRNTMPLDLALDCIQDEPFTIKDDNATQLDNKKDESDFNDMVESFGQILKSKINDEPQQEPESNLNDFSEDFTTDLEVSDFVAKVEKQFGIDLTTTRIEGEDFEKLSLLIKTLETSPEKINLDDEDILKQNTNDEESNIDHKKNVKDEIFGATDEVSWDVGQSFSSEDWVAVDGQGSPPAREPIQEKASLRSRRKRNGDPEKWMNLEEDPTNPLDPATLWNSVSNSSSFSSWDNISPPKNKSTGAVPKQRREVNNRTLSETTPKVESNSISCQTDLTNNDDEKNGYKILFGNPNNFVSKVPEDNFVTDNVTRNKLKLDQGCMTEEIIVSPKANESLQSLIAFFPNLEKSDLKDVLEKCQYDLDWATNVLLDGGYEMSLSSTSPSLDDLTDSSDSCADPEPSHDDSNSVQDNDLMNKSHNKVKQSLSKSAITNKKEIENSFLFSDSVDDRTKRLTGKEYNDLNLHNIKKRKGKNKKSGKKEQQSSPESQGSSPGTSTGMQYLTVVMDPLFCLHLKQMYGPVGSFDVSEESNPDERSVVLPLDLCQKIHHYWKSTVEGKFLQEAAVLDRLVREDEELARNLQKEENEKLNHNPITSDFKFDADPPTSFKEIMALESAIQDSKEGMNVNLTISSNLTLKKLCDEYFYIDPKAVRDEFLSANQNYNDTVVQLISKYGTVTDVPKTVIAPEAKERYDKRREEIAKKCQDQEDKWRQEIAQHWEDEEIKPNDPQVRFLFIILFNLRS